MSVNHVAIPDFLPTLTEEPPDDIKRIVFKFYKRMSEIAERLESAERRWQEQSDEQSRRLNRVISSLAAERFEFERLMKRILPELEKSGMEDIGKVLTLYARSWDANLNRAQVEVTDLTGAAITDELAEMIEVESAIPDPAAQETTVRETFFPLIRHEGRIIGLAKVITSVPVPPDEEFPS